MHGNSQEAHRYAYCAGIFDGEGTFVIGKNQSKKNMEKYKRKNPIYMTRLRLGMTCLDTIDFFADTFPGIGARYDDGVYKAKEMAHRKVMHRWEVNNRNMIIFVIDKLMPFLVTKKKQAIHMRQFCEKWFTSYRKGLGLEPEELQRREEAYCKMRELNRLGAPATTE